MSETVKLPLIGETKKPVAVGGAIVIAGVFLVLWWRQRQSASASTASVPSSTDTGNIDPATGYPSGSPEDQQALAAQQQAQLAAGGYSPYGYGTGTGAFYGTGGTTGPVPPGPGGFSDNAQWAQYAEQFLTQTEGTNAETVGNAIGKYITAQPLTPSQVQVVEQAIAFAGYPPVEGPGGNPPGFRTASTQHHPKPKPGTGKVTVPAVTGRTWEEAVKILAAHHLRARRGNTQTGLVVKQNPDAGDQAARNSAVTLNMQNARK